MAKPGSIFTNSPTSRPSTESLLMSLAVINVLFSPLEVSINPTSPAETVTLSLTSPICNVTCDSIFLSAGSR